jgi:hypothetical protein
MIAPAWRIEFDRAAARYLRKLGTEAAHAVLRYLRERIAAAEDPRRFGGALTGGRKASGAIASAFTVSWRRSRTGASWC